MAEYYTPKELLNEADNYPLQQPQQKPAQNKPIKKDMFKPSVPSKEEETNDEDLLDYENLEPSDKLAFHLDGILTNINKIESPEFAAFQLTKSVLLNTINENNSYHIIGNLEVLKQAIIKNFHSEDLNDLED